MIDGTGLGGVGWRLRGLEARSDPVKIHDDADREHLERDTFVVAEDQYIDYLAGQGARTGQLCAPFTVAVRKDKTVARLQFLLASRAFGRLKPPGAQDEKPPVRGVD